MIFGGYFFRKVNQCRQISLLLKWPKHGGHLRPEEASGRKGPEVNSEDQMLDEANEDVLAEINLGE